ncbi:MAG: VWA domain-containing protein [Acidobacteriota bacterium]
MLYSNNFKTTLILSGFLLTPMAFGQQTDPKQPVIRVDTRLVEVDVVVRDAKGPVKGLTKEDFTVLDNGKPQRISSFSIKEGRASTKLRPMAAGAVSNRINSLGEEPASVTVVLWDTLNTDLDDQGWVRAQITKYLAQLKPDDRVALYKLGKSVSVMQDFSDDPAALVKALPKMNLGAPFNLSNDDISPNVIVDLSGGASADQAAAIAEVNAMAQNEYLETAWYSLRDRVWVTTRALQAIAQHLGGLPGRKKLIWVSAGFPIVSMTTGQRNNTTQIETLDLSNFVQKAIQVLNHANVAVYPIDARGLSSKDTGGNLAGNQLSGTPQIGLNATGIDTMNFVASGTGGHAFYAGNDIAGSVREVLQDAEVTYSLAFTPSNPQPKADKNGVVPEDDSYHSLSVKVARKGLDLRYRKGYMATDVIAASDSQRKAQLNADMQAALDSTGIGLTAVNTPDKSTPSLYHLDLNIDIHDLHFQQRDDSAGNPRWLASIDFATMLANTQKPIGTQEEISINLTEPRLREALTNGLIVSRPLAYEGPASKVRILIQDRATGKAGSVSVAVGPK